MSSPEPIEAEAPSALNQERTPADVGELVQRRRLEEIFEARKAFTDAKMHIADRRVSPGQTIDQKEAAHALRACLETYIMYVEPMFSEADEPDYWYEEIELGEIPPPDGSDVDPLPIRGFSSIIEREFPIPFETVEEKPHELKGRIQETQITHVELPPSVSNQAFRALNEFLRDHGIKYRMEDKLPTDEL